MKVFQLIISDAYVSRDIFKGLFLFEEHAQKYADYRTNGDHMLSTRIQPLCVIDYDTVQEELDREKLKQETLASLTPQQKEALGL
jgi:hypothetical protein